ncbi:ATP synthase subunit delta [bioreactor metagenome]|uniref:ATP synthase subunit delta n=1 Tax=bioreactor metagenome TaxID=1076179 RepID=A0A645G9N8_9ZZZZ|nr:ATP synthase F1 subunit delta [Erysipelotrichaceae bacterium]
MNVITSRYTSALIELAAENDSLDVFRAQFKMIKETFTANPDLLVFLKHYLISKADKKAALAKIFYPDIDEMIMNFMYIIIDHDRCSMIELIIADFLAKSNALSGISSGIVYSVRELDKQQLTELETALGLRFGGRIELENRIDKDLLSGVKVVVGDQVIDGSIRNKLSQLKENLLRRGG